MMVNDVTEQIIGAAIEVHRALGPGLLESTYEACLVHELAERKLHTERQKALPVSYKGVRIDCGYRIDMLVEREVIVELKAVAHIEAIHEAHCSRTSSFPAVTWVCSLTSTSNSSRRASGGSSTSSQNHLCDLCVLCGEPWTWWG